MRAAAKKRFRQSRPSCCMYCGVLIKCDMYRHVVRFHLDLAQLWRCPVSWCTVWKGTPQDCMDHICGTHDVPWEIKSAILENSTSLLGQLCGKCGQIRWRLSTRGFRWMCCCLVTSTCPQARSSSHCFSVELSVTATYSVGVDGSPAGGRGCIT